MENLAEISGHVESQWLLVYSLYTKKFVEASE